MGRLSPSQLQAELDSMRQSYHRGDLRAVLASADAILLSNPDCGQAHFGKGMALSSGNRPADALHCFLQAVRYEPGNPEPLYYAAMTSLTVGDPKQAESLARRLTQIQAQNPRAFFLLTNALCMQGRLLEGLSCIDRCLSFQPNEPDFLAAKAQILGRLGWASQAIDWYRKALQARPNPALASELAEALMSEGRVKEAVPLLDHLMAQLPAQRRPYRLLAQAYTESGRFKEAEEAWATARRTRGDDAELLLSRTASEIHAGRLEVAERLLGEGVERFPKEARFFSQLSTIKKIGDDDSRLVESLLRFHSDSGLGLDVRIDVEYALGKAYHDLGEYGKAMAAYDEANRLRLETVSGVNPFDPDAWRAYVDLQIQFFSAAKLKALSAEGLDADQPLFIVGMVRSGTTLTEQILSGHSQVLDGGETTFWPDRRDLIFNRSTSHFDMATARRLGKEYLQILSPDGCRYFTEKNPSNIFLAPMLHAVFPRAKFVHVRRNPVDNLLSIWMTPLKTGLPFVYDRKNLVFAYREYQRLAKHLEAVIPSDRFRTFGYEDLTSSPRATIEGMLGYLELEPEEACFHPEENKRTVRTPSFYQVRQPINTSSQEKWKRYERWLGAFSEFL